MAHQQEKERLRAECKPLLSAEEDGEEGGGGGDVEAPRPESGAAEGGAGQPAAPALTRTSL